MTKVSQEAREAAAKAIASYLFQECQPDRGDVFSWVDDRLDPLAQAAIAAALPFIEAETLERAARVAESHYMWAGKPDYVPACRSIGLAIRNLKDKSNV